MRTRLRTALTAAMKARDPIAVSALRSGLAAIANAEAVDASAAEPEGTTSSDMAGARTGLGAGDVTRRVVDQVAVRAILRTEVTDRLCAAAEYESLGQPERGERLRAEADVLTGHLDSAVT